MFYTAIVSLLSALVFIVAGWVMIKSANAVNKSIQEWLKKVSEKFILSVEPPKAGNAPGLGDRMASKLNSTNNSDNTTNANANNKLESNSNQSNVATQGDSNAVTESNNETNSESNNSKSVSGATIKGASYGSAGSELQQSQVGEQTSTLEARGKEVEKTGLSKTAGGATNSGSEKLVAGAETSSGKAKGLVNSEVKDSDAVAGEGTEKRAGVPNPVKRPAKGVQPVTDKDGQATVSESEAKQGESNASTKVSESKVGENKASIKGDATQRKTQTISEDVRVERNQTDKAKLSGTGEQETRARTVREDVKVERGYVDDNIARKSGAVNQERRTQAIREDVKVDRNHTISDTAKFAPKDNAVKAAPKGIKPAGGLKPAKRPTKKLGS